MQLALAICIAASCLPKKRAPTASTSYMHNSMLLAQEESQLVARGALVTADWTSHSRQMFKQLLFWMLPAVCKLAHPLLVHAKEESSCCYK